MKIIDFIKLLRITQWYKNLLIFLPIIFSLNLLQPDKLLLTIIGFISLCLISSSNYILNDIIDIKKDRANPEKRKRPLASGAVKIWQALIIFALFSAVSVILALNLNMNFLYAVIFLFGFTLFYSLILKKEPFADIIVIGINFVVRAMSGAFIIDVKISPWLILCTFFLAVYLTAGKRHSELALLGRKAKEHRDTLQFYTPALTSALMIIATTILIISYSLYTFLSEHNYLIYTLPFALYAIFRYFQLIYSDSEIARHPERVVLDLRMILGMLLWAGVTFYILYFV